MSLEVFPTLKGLEFGTSVTPSFNTGISTSVNGNETRTSFQAYPLWDFELSYEWLPNRVAGKQDLERIVGFFLNRQGSFEAFLYLAPETPVENTRLGISNGVFNSFQLIKTTGGFIEPAGGVATKEDIQVYQDSVLMDPSTYSLVDNRQIVFNTVPSAGKEIWACYQPLYRVRFKEDTAQFNQFMSRLWELQQISLRSVFA